MESKFVALQNGACLSALVVDDSELYRAYAQRILKSAGYTVHTASSGEDAILLLKNIPAPNVILLDVIMKGLDGYETFAVISESEGTSEIPVIFLTAETQSHNELKGFKMGAADYISKPFIPEIMLKRVEKVIELDLLKKDLAKQVSLKTAQLEIISNQAIETIAAIIDARERYANGHSTRVAKVSTEIARTLGWSREKQMEIYDIALLHDVGKIAIPDLVLNKPTKLTDSEYDIIKAHTTAGSEMLKEISVIKGMSEGARWHHERYDGNGYPDGLRGTEIPPSARIIGIADAYDAMASKRPYRNGFPNDFIIDELIKGRGTQFDPMLSDIMVKIIRSGEKINEIEGLGVVKGSLASECSALLYHVYNKSIQENRREMGLDGLTQVYSRKFFEMDITGVLAEQSGSLLMIDIDNYKKINDTYGHITGDNILMLLADTLRLNIGEGD
ncbi:MAG: response regulator, partial [Oscillospiraceae bacterium]